MGGKAMVAAGVGRFVFPESPGGLRHFPEEAFDVFDELFPFPAAEDQLQAEKIADESVGGRNFLPFCIFPEMGPIGDPFRAEVV